MKFKKGLSAILVCSLIVGNTFNIFADDAPVSVDTEDNTEDVAQSAENESADEGEIIPDEKVLYSGDVSDTSVITDEVEDAEVNEGDAELSAFEATTASTPKYAEYTATGEKDGVQVEYSITVKYNYSYGNEDNCGQIFTVSKTEACDMEIPAVITVNDDGEIRDVVIRSVETTAFANCAATSIVLPSSVKEIKDNAFQNCPNLKSVTIKSSVDNYAITAADENGTLVPGDIAAVEKNNKTTYSIISTVIGDGVFQDCTALESAEISGFEKIGDSLFSGCTSLKDVSFDFSNMYSINSSTGQPTSSTRTASIGNYGFQNCTSLESVTLPDSLKSVGSSGFFDGCSALKTVNVGLDLTSGLSSKSFTNCPVLESIHVAGENADPYSDNSGENRWNKSYRSIDGVLYSGVSAKGVTVVGEDGENIKNDAGTDLKVITVTTIVVYPVAKKDTVYNAPDTLTTIPANAFENNAYLETVVIDTLPTYSVSKGVVTTTEKTVTIGSSAFANCLTLKSLTINNICTISNNAFDGCTSLSTFVHAKPESTIKSTMGDYAFRNCALTELNLTYWKSIGKNAFEGNGELKSLVVDSTIGTIGNNAFTNCIKLTDADMTYCALGVDGTNTMGTGLFEGCTALESVKLPLALVSLGNDTFKDCTALKDVTFGDNISTIGSNAFANCVSLEGITPSRFLVNIYTNAFSGCTKLANITLTRSVKNIQDGAFEGCTNLKTITAPVDTYAEEYAKSNKYTLKSVENDILDEEFLLYGTVSLGTKKAEDVEEYDSQYLYQDTSGNYMLYSVIGYRGGFEKLTFSESYTPYIAKGFIASPVEKNSSMVNYLQAVDLRGIKNVGSSAFASCKNLTTAVFDDSLLSIASSAFSNCEKLCSSVIWEMSDTRIGESGDVVIADDAAYSVVIPNSCKSIGASAFSNCKLVTALDISGSNVTSIGKSAFENCTSLESITLGDNISEIGESAFKGCTSLLRVDLPHELLEIKANTFANCTSLARVSFNIMLNHIYGSAFLNCKALTTLTFNRNIFFEKDAFKGCDAIKTIAITDASNIVSTRDPFTSATDCTILCTDTSQATAYTKAKDYSAQTVEFLEGVNYVVVKAGISMADGLTITKNDETEVKNGGYAVVDDVLVVKAPDNADGGNAMYYVNGKLFGAGTSAKYVIKEDDYDLTFTYDYNAKAYTGADVDGDGNITANDSALVLQKVLNSEFVFPVADADPNVDGDDSLTANDAALILQKVLNSAFKFPVEE